MATILLLLSSRTNERAAWQLVGRHDLPVTCVVCGAAAALAMRYRCGKVQHDHQRLHHCSAWLLSNACHGTTSISTPLPCSVRPGLSLAVALMVCLLCSFGGFGSDFCSGNTAEMWRDRCEFVRLAPVKAGALHPGSLAGRVHVGDTPMDVAAALGAGAGALGVTTGEGGCLRVGVACMVYLRLSTWHGWMAVSTAVAESISSFGVQCPPTHMGISCTTAAAMELPIQTFLPPAQISRALQWTAYAPVDVPSLHPSSSWPLSLSCCRCVQCQGAGGCWRS